MSTTEADESILREILDWRASGRRAGCDPSDIRLTANQYGRLKAWVAWHEELFRNLGKPSSLTTGPVDPITDGVIFGMKIIKPE